MQIIGVARCCRSGNQARFILELVSITNQQKKNFTVLTFLGSENFKWTMTLKLLKITFFCVKSQDFAIFTQL